MKIVLLKKCQQSQGFYRISIAAAKILENCHIKFCKNDIFLTDYNYLRT